MIGWIDFSKKERNNVNYVLDNLSEKEAVDELGLGIIRDAFADYFFPGTSTLMTGAKYFLIVPYILNDVRKGKNNIDVGKEIEKNEKKCREIMVKNSKDKNGIIGSKDLNGWVKRPPSDIYWSGIKRIYNIDYDYSIKNYIDEIKRIKKNVDENDCNYDDNLPEIPTSPYYGEEWKEDLNINLKEKEAKFLKENIIKNCEDSLFAFILKNNISLNKYKKNDISFKQDIFFCLTKDIKENYKDKLNQKMLEMMELANDFNKLVYVIAVRYNMILLKNEYIEKNKNAKIENKWNEVKDNIKNKVKVDIDEMFKKINLKNDKLNIFLKNIKKAIAKNNIKKIDNLIKEREKKLKDGRAKTNNKNCKEEDKGKEWIGIEKYDFRFRTAKKIIDDIMKAEGKK